MNKERREAISKLHNQLNDILSDIESLRDEEQEYYDNMPESLQSGERGSAAEEAIQNLEDAVNSTQEAIDSLGNIEF